MLACDFRQAARSALTGKWALAVGVSFLAGLMGASLGSSLPSFNVRTQNIDTYGEVNTFIHRGLWLMLRPVVFTLLTLLVIWILIAIVIGGAATLGYAVFTLNLATIGRPGWTICFPSSIVWAPALECSFSGRCISFSGLCCCSSPVLSRPTAMP